MEMCFCISDIYTFFVSVGGMILALIYLFKMYIRGSTIDFRYDEDLKEEIERRLEEANNDNRLSLDGLVNAILKDYEISNIVVQRRDNITLLVGSILIGASFLILANTNFKARSSPPLIYAITSIGLFSVWLWVLHYTSRVLNDISFDRIKAIERALGNENEEIGLLGYNFGIHSYHVTRTRSEYDRERAIYWLWTRRMFWGFVLLVLSIGWFLLSVA